LRSSWSNSSFSRLRRDERGQGLVEYALIILLVATVVVGALAAFGADLAGMVESVADSFP
jgi:pilus assembly protein Flp/PilA